jgi:hypothetical protein
MAKTGGRISIGWGEESPVMCRGKGGVDVKRWATVVQRDKRAAEE